MAKLPDGQPYRRKTWVDLVIGPNSFAWAQPTKKKPWIPNSHCSLKEAIDKFGQADVSDWDGSERSSTNCKYPPDPPWNWSPDKKSESDYFVIEGNHSKIPASKERALSWWNSIKPTLIEEWEVQNRSRDRWLTAIDMLRNAFSINEFEASIITHTGEFIKIPDKVWRGENGGSMFHTGDAEFVITAGLLVNTVSGPIVLKKDFLSPQTDDVRTEETETELNTDVDKNKFPYLAFMVRATRELNFSNTGRTSKKIIEAWLVDNWPAELGSPSPTKIGNMATFLRRPGDEVGGLHGKGKGH